MCPTGCGSKRDQQLQDKHRCVEIIPMRVSNWEIIGLSLKALNN